MHFSGCVCQCVGGGNNKSDNRRREDRRQGTLPSSPPSAFDIDSKKVLLHVAFGCSSGLYDKSPFDMKNSSFIKCERFDHC